MDGHHNSNYCFALFLCFALFVLYRVNAGNSGQKTYLLLSDYLTLTAMWYQPAFI